MNRIFTCCIVALMLFPGWSPKASAQDMRVLSLEAEQEKK